MNFEQKTIEFNKMVDLMDTIEHGPEVSILDHGDQVFTAYKKLLNKGYNAGSYRVPKWLEQNRAWIKDQVYDEQTMYRYLVFHDCGKPYCRKVDADGKVHYPNHAKISKEKFLKFTQGEELVADLIGWDMCIHIMSAEELQAMGWNVHTAMSLCMSALAEVHANAFIFGGMESQSFKTKWKKIDRRGNMFVKMFKN